MKNQKPNIIFLSIDGLRPENLSCYGYERETSPNIDSCAKKGTLFENFFSSCSVTYKAFSLILGGRYILSRDFGNYTSKKEMQYFFNTGGVLLSEQLKELGYKTYFLEKLFGWQKKGFDYYFEEDSLEASKKWRFIKSLKKSPLIHDFFKYILHRTHLIPQKLESKIRYKNNGERITNKAIEIIKQNKENNFFLWLHYDDTHVPHMFPDDFNNKFGSQKKGRKIFDILNSMEGYNQKSLEFLRGCWKHDETIEGIIAKYDTAIFYDDSLIGKIIDTLNEENLMENTIVFIFADHGTSLGEHRIYFTPGGIYDVSMKIPLIIFGRGIPKNKRINALTHLSDLAPTVLDLIGVKYDSLLFDGKSLLSLFKEDKEIRNSIFIEEQNVGIKRRAIRTKKYKYMETPEEKYSVCKLCNTTHGPLVALYNLEKDPDENVNIAEKNKKLTKEMKFKMDKWLSDLKRLNEKRRIQILIKKNKFFQK